MAFDIVESFRRRVRPVRRHARRMEAGASGSTRGFQGFLGGAKPPSRHYVILLAAMAAEIVCLGFSRVWSLLRTGRCHRSKTKRPKRATYSHTRRTARRRRGYQLGPLIVVSVQIPHKIITGTNTSPYRRPLHHARKRRGRPPQTRIWIADIKPWATRTIEISPDAELPLGRCFVADSKRRRGARLRYEQEQRLSVDGAGHIYTEVGYVPISYPIVRRQQKRRVRVLERAGLEHLAEKAMGPRGQEFLNSEGFSDRPANLFSIRQRIAAFTDVGKAVAKDVPSYAYSFGTILAGIVDFRAMTPLQVRVLMDDTRMLVATSLRQSGAVAAYVNGFWELAEHAYPNSYIPIHAYLDAWQISQGHTHKPRRKSVVLHLHLSILAHDGSKWIPVDAVKTCMEAASVLPHQVLVGQWRRFDLLDNLRRTIAYAEKPPHLASVRLIVQDAIFRDAVSPAEQWPEGWLRLYPNLPLPGCLVRNALRRQKEIEKFTLFGAAGPFQETQLWWG